jgi:hypothetical protein
MVITLPQALLLLDGLAMLLTWQVFRKFFFHSLFVYKTTSKTNGIIVRLQKLRVMQDGLGIGRQRFSWLLMLQLQALVACTSSSQHNMCRDSSQRWNSEPLVRRGVGDCGSIMHYALGDGRSN